MKRVYLSLVAALCCSLPAQADSHNVDRKPAVKVHHDMAGKAGGVYGGAMVGYLSGNSRVKKTMLVGPHCHDKSDVGGNGITGGVFVGYKKVFPNQIFIAPEAFATINAMSGKT